MTLRAYGSAGHLPRRGPGGESYVLGGNADGVNPGSVKQMRRDGANACIYLRISVDQSSEQQWAMAF